MGYTAVGQRRLETTIKNQNRRIAELEAQLATLDLAVKWALGEEGNFGPRPKKVGTYWWRTELRKRAYPPAKGPSHTELREA